MKDVRIRTLFVVSAGRLALPGVPVRPGGRVAGRRAVHVAFARFPV
jgi:hypothetical protein